MAAIAFDTLKFARRLKEVGVPEAQAEAQAELMAEAFVFNMDALVTKDYLDECLDARFGAFRASLATDFTRIDQRFDQRLETLAQRLDASLSGIDNQLHAHDLQFEAMRGEQKLQRWILALILVTTTVPYLQKLFVLFAA